MVCERWMHPGWLSNSYLVADREAGEGIIVDSGADPEPIVAAARTLGVKVLWIVNTHHHHDHTAGNEALRRELGADVAVHVLEAALIPGVRRRLEDGEVLAAGDLEARVLHIPGHTAGQIALLVRARSETPQRVFTGDTLFRRSVGGTKGPGHTTFEDLRRSLLERLLALPPETIVLPGHASATTVGEEWEHNPFVRVMRGIDAPGTASCRFAGRPARLIVWARDYDGGHKAWIRFEDGEDAVVPGSGVSL
ncbi:MAG: metal-binding protein [Acidobacteria bacterium]|nr:MAG: metal-binding protein [Acidobacteriota bacterium]